MSDLNDLIATNAINAYNSGLQTGIAQERKRIAKWAEEAADEYGQIDLFDILDQVEEPHIVIKGEQE